MLDSDAIKLFETVNGAQRLSICLENAKPLGAIGSVRRLVYSSRDLVANDPTDFVVETSRNWDVLLDPRDVRDDCHRNGREEVLAKATTLGIVPGERSVVEHHEIVKEALFLR